MSSALRCFLTSYTSNIQPGFVFQGSSFQVANCVIFASVLYPRSKNLEFALIQLLLLS